MYSGSSTQLGQEAVQQVDAALVVRLVGRHVVGADPVVYAGAGSAHGRRYVVAGAQVAHVRPHLEHAPERLVARDQKVVALRGGAVLSGVDLPVRPVHSDAQYLDEHAAPIGNVVDTWLWQVCQVHAVGLTGEDGDRFHPELSFSAVSS